MPKPLFQKGNPGRQKGAKNRLTANVKETVLAVFNQLQGDEKHNLRAFAEKHPRDFYAIAAKLIPTEIKGDVKVTKVELLVRRTKNNPQS